MPHTGFQCYESDAKIGQEIKVEGHGTTMLGKEIKGKLPGDGTFEHRGEPSRHKIPQWQEKFIVRKVKEAHVNGQGIRGWSRTRNQGRK